MSFHEGKVIGRGGGRGFGDGAVWGGNQFVTNFLEVIFWLLISE